ESIRRFCRQVAGVLHTASLFQQVEQEREKSDRLLYNILPDTVADELKESGRVQPRKHDSVTILFTDFKAFTADAEIMPVEELVEDLDAVFEQFDRICGRYNLEKLKTIGDSYMAAGGLTLANSTHPVDAVLAAMEFMDFVEQVNRIRQEITGGKFWSMRVGVHTGPVVSGVIGRSRFAYDIWGDAVNVASRMESAGEPGRLNISQTTYDQVKYFFDCEYRGRLPIKNRGAMEMYFVSGVRRNLSGDHPGRLPDDNFRALYERLKQGARLRFKNESAHT
ncbi:MAG: adenylate cyclase, partial [Leptospiraceae bacterium]|nr:adenylate cyclase [Leptospiraceae bacterium]